MQTQPNQSDELKGSVLLRMALLSNRILTVCMNTAASEALKAEPCQFNQLARSKLSVQLPKYSLFPIKKDSEASQEILR